MASIEASIKLYEDFSQKLTAVDKAMNSTIAIMERLRTQMQMAIGLQINIGNTVAELQRVKELLAALGPGNAIQLSVNSEQVLQQLRTVRQQMGSELGAAVLEIRVVNDFAAQLATIQSSLPAIQLSATLDTTGAVQSASAAREDILRGLGALNVTLTLQIPDVSAQMSALRAAVPPIQVTLNAGAALSAASLLGVQLQTRIGTITAEVKLELPDAAAVRSQLQSLIHGMGSHTTAIRISVNLDTAHALHQATLLRSQLEARIGTITATLNLTLPATLDTLLQTLIRTVDKLRILVDRLLGSGGGGGGGGGGGSGSRGGGGGLGLGNILAGVGGVMGAKALGTAMLGGAMEQQKMVDMFIARTGDAEIGTAMFDKFKADALKAGQDVNKSLQSTLSFFSTTQNTKQLEKLNNFAQRMNAFDSAGNGIEGAAFALKEAMSGDIVSLAERFNMSKSDIRGLKIDELGKAGDMDGFIKAFDKLLEKQKMGQAAFDQMMSSPAKQVETLGNNVRSMFADAGGAAMQSLTPLITQINDAFQAGKFQPFFDSLSSGLEWVVETGTDLLNIITDIYNFFSNNWSMISPVIVGIVTVLGLYKGALMAISIWTGLTAAAELIGASIKAAYSGATLAATSATAAQTAAQWGLNAALLASPITWIVLAVIALIAIFYAVIGAINKFAGTSFSATGMITGAFAVMGAFIGNLFLGLMQLVLGVIEIFYNAFVDIGNFIGNVFTDPVGAIIKLFADMADQVLSVLQNIASAMDFIFGTNWGDKIGGWREDVAKFAGEKMEEYGNGKYEEYLEKLDTEAMTKDLKRFNYGDAYSAGYNWGADLVGGDDGSDATKDALDKANQPYNFDDWNKRADAGRTPGGADDKLKKVDKVGKVEKPIDISKEDLKIMRDVAEMKNIQNFVTLTPTVQVKTGPVNNQANVDSIVTKITKKLNEEIASTAKGVYS